MGGSQSGKSTNDEEGTAMNTSRILPVCALFISAVACVASLYQLHMASSSISAQTWPYVTIGWSYANDETGVVIDNDGLGPALIRDVVLTIDQHEQHDAVSAVRQIINNPNAEIRIDALTRGVVVRAGQSRNLFVVRGTTSANQLRAAQARVNLEICYCSILGRCWTNSLADIIPRSISKCTDSDTKGLVLPRM
jgi:hypothetical protein